MKVSDALRAEVNRVEALIRDMGEDRTLRSDEKKAALTTLLHERDALEDRRQKAEDSERASATRDLMETREGQHLSGAVRDGYEASSGEGELEWRSLLPSRTELRDQTTLTDAAGGATVPTGVGAKYVENLVNRAVFLKGLPAENVIRYSTKDFEMPVLADSDMPALVAENATITGGDDTWDSITFTSKKYGDLRRSSNELLADSAVDQRAAIARTLTRNAAAQFDHDAFQGASAPLLGIVGQGNSVQAGTTTGDVASWDELADACGRILAADGDPSVIWVAPDVATALAKERVGTEGVYLVPDSPLAIARRLPVLQSTSVPAGTAICADGSRVYAGIRSDVRVAVSEHFEFDADRVVWRLTYRVAGIYVVETSSVQVITKHA